jgi:hypothetical protein
VLNQARFRSAEREYQFSPIRRKLMCGSTFSIKSIYDAINEQMVAIKGKEFKSQHILIKDRLGNEYLVSQINLQNCIKNNNIVFCSYYPTGETKSKNTVGFGVAVPIELYAGMELYSSLPKYLEKKYKSKGTDIGFDKTL